MTVLASAVAIGANQIVIDAPLADGSFPAFVKIDSEILNVGGADNRTGKTLTLSTPATATHNNGATVTYAGRPYSAAFLAATTGTGSGSLTLDNTVDAPAEVTTIIAAGAVIDGAEATLAGVPDPSTGADGDMPTVASGVYELTQPSKDFYAQDADPGAVGHGSVWKDTSTGLWWVRNPLDTAWLPRSQVIVESSGTASAFATQEAIATGTGAANATLNASAVDGDAVAQTTAFASEDGSAVVAPGASTAGTGIANAGSTATASGDGVATVLAQAISTTNQAIAGSTATRGAVTAGIFAQVDTNGVAKLGFNAVAGTEGIAIPEIPASPTEQDIADVLVALGLATQAS